MGRYYKAKILKWSPKISFEEGISKLQILIIGKMLQWDEKKEKLQQKWFEYLND